MQQTGIWFQRGKTFLIQLRELIMAPPAQVQPPVWYSGVGIEPAEFSEQLARLQISLNFPAKPKPDVKSENSLLH